MLHATQHIKKLDGSSHAHLLSASDRNYWVVKFQNNPKHVRVLANEKLAYGLAATLGLTVPLHSVIEVSQWLVDNTQGLTIDKEKMSIPCKAGLQFGSRFIGDVSDRRLRNYLREEELYGVRNICEFTGMLAFDKWVANVDGRQALFVRDASDSLYTACFFDFGHCFGCGTWVLDARANHGTYLQKKVYSQVTGWESFEPWLTRIETMDVNSIWEVAVNVPQEWCSGSPKQLERLVLSLARRRQAVRELINDFRQYPTNPFPKWV